MTLRAGLRIAVGFGVVGRGRDFVAALSGIGRRPVGAQAYLREGGELVGLLMALGAIALYIVFAAMLWVWRPPGIAAPESKDEASKKSHPALAL